MPEYLAPGVYVEEVSFRPKSIEGVSTSTCAFVGPARKGPVTGTPEIITSFGEFERIYGGFQNLSFSANTDSIPGFINYMAHAVRAFFDNGGKRLYIGRTFITRTDGGGNVTSDGTASVSIYSNGANEASIISRSPGSGYNGEIRIYQKRRRIASSRMASAPQGSFLCVASAAGDNAQPAVIAGAKPTFAVNEGDQLELVLAGGTETITFAAADVNDLNAVSVAEINVLLENADIPVFASLPPSTGMLTLSTTDTGAAATLRIGDNSTRIALGLPTTAAAGQDGATLLFYEKQGSNWVGGADGITVLDTTAVTNAEIISFNLEAIDSDGCRIVYDDLSFSSTHPKYIGQVLLQNPTNRSDALQNPFYFNITGTVTTLQMYNAMFSVQPENSFSMTGGNDGAEPAPITTVTGGASYSDALELLEDIDDISIIAAPGHSALTSGSNFESVQDALISHAERMKYRIAVLDTEEDQTITDARETRGRIDTTYAALYYPWVVVPNPLARQGNETIPKEIAVPPSGFVAGIYARTDINRGVWKPPANEIVRGALRFEREINHRMQEILNPEGINCLRFFFGRGNRVWGARTASSDPEWKYVNVRRYFIYLEHSIDRSTQWAVFEPNGPRLWSNITDTITAFLYNEWRNGALLGSTPNEAFFVRCDRSTMTQADIDNGRMICEIGVAAIKPAEFVIFRIGQKTAETN